MSCVAGPTTLTNGLILSLDAANVDKSFPGPLGPELVTDTRLTQIDGITGNVFRDATTSVPLTICPVTAGKTYYVEYYMSSFPGTIHATFRVGASTGNMTSVSPLGTAAYIGAGAVGVMRAYIFTALTTNNLSIYGDNAGTDLNMDYVSVKEILSGAGTAFNDLSGNGNTGTLISNPVYSRSNNGIFTFDGTSNEVTTATQFTNPQTFSIGAWFNTSTASGTKIIGLESNQTGTGSASFDRSIYIGTDGKLNFYLYAPIGGSKIASSPLTYTDNTWHYVVATYGSEGTTMRLYVDGTSVATADASAAQNYNGWWRIGGYKGGTVAGYFTGNISNAQVYNRGISADEILQNFNALRGRYNI